VSQQQNHQGQCGELFYVGKVNFLRCYLTGQFGGMVRRARYTNEFNEYLFLGYAS
jgi:hypothetical protein